MRKAGVLLCAALLGATAACAPAGFDGIYDLPLPGGADLGDHPYRVTAQFRDVLDLVPHSAVKVNDVAVGRVESIGLGGKDDWTAQVVLSVNGDITLPANAVANIRQSSLLGEKFVELAAPRNETEAGIGELGDGALIPLTRTNRHPEVEEVFGALSLLLNGGGIGQLQTITRELNDVMDGNEKEIKSFLTGVDTLMTNLDQHRTDITAALDGLNRLASTLAERDEAITGALNNLSPGLAALSEQRTALVTMLQSLDELSDVTVDVINRSKDDMVADLKALAPLLGRLADAGQNLPQALEILPTFPFTDAVLDGLKGDYLNAFVEITPSAGYTEPIPPLPIPPTSVAPTEGGTP
ncbi:ABC transporter substrate-binding protein [Prauserella marina]|uniref:Phospholipid/cholesterol/gamma-HCH transport system substrate-binding protein n=1 Tax=Prauserella marina TaxID=530584 RepID=A0A222VL85_9PSEU|nr:MCE family protein [Prauserella marina]ASR34689.1 ABC transporter substrate-binding protein [Prauserella marina]PWV85652.1 phospholipid/cholesterol/gamma-HCH transport system substrate-binding protein [Prauserella marina]SDC49335.1 phospholipid/cholesterol/gamma-HCH transport system substrate-binding protein [Prauserella marina]